MAVDEKLRAMTEVLEHLGWSVLTREREEGPIIRPIYPTGHPVVAKRRVPHGDGLPDEEATVVRPALPELFEALLREGPPEERDRAKAYLMAETAKATDRARGLGDALFAVLRAS